MHNLYKILALVCLAYATPVFAQLTLGSGALTLSSISGSNQCLHVNSSGVVSGTGSDCAVGTSVSNSDGTLTISPTTGTIVASLNLGNANTWTGLQSFNAILTSTLTLSAISGSTQCLQVNSSGVVSGTGAPCGSGGAGVTSFSGDGVIISNSASTGAVTDTLASAGAHTILGNNTTSAATPTYTSNPSVSSITLNGSTSGSAMLSVSTTGGTLNLGSTNATVTSAGALTVASVTTAPSGGQGGTVTLPEGTAATGSSGNDVCYGDSTHSVKCSYNNGSFFTMSQTVNSGSSALGTSAIASGACVTTTTAATGIATTDAILWNPNASIKAVTGYVPSTSGGLTIAAYPTSGNVNFDVCNWTASSITPGAIIINWRVVR